jgi:hypothetical protein
VAGGAVERRRGLHDYTGEPGDLRFSAGDVIEITSRCLLLEPGIAIPASPSNYQTTKLSKIVKADAEPVSHRAPGGGWLTGRVGTGAPGIFPENFASGPMPPPGTPPGPPPGVPPPAAGGGPNVWRRAKRVALTMVYSPSRHKMAE